MFNLDQLKHVSNRGEDLVDAWLEEAGQIISKLAASLSRRLSPKALEQTLRMISYRLATALHAFFQRHLEVLRRFYLDHFARTATSLAAPFFDIAIVPHNELADGGTTAAATHITFAP